MKPIKIDIKAYLRSYKTAGLLLRFARADYNVTTQHDRDMKKQWSDAVDNIRAITDSLQSAMNPILAKEEARCHARTLSAETVLRACREAEDHLDDMGVGKAARVGAILYVTPGAESFPRRYARKAHCVGYTEAQAERRAGGWYITKIYRCGAAVSCGVPASSIVLTQAQRDAAASHLVNRACTLA